VFLVEPGYAAHTQTVALTAELDPPGAPITWLVDGRAAASPWQLQPGRHRLEAVAAGRASAPVEFEVR
jgi:hypothetical protein